MELAQLQRTKRYDFDLLLAIGLLVVSGLMIMYSTSAYNGQIKFQDQFYYLKKQAFATAVGIVFMFFVANVDYHIWEHFAVPAYVCAIALSVAVILFGDEYNGSKRWLSFGPISFQPSEFAKIAVILFVSHVIAKHAKKMNRFLYLIYVMMSIMPVAGLVGASNLSTAIIILGIGAILVFISSPKYAQFIWLILGGVAFLTIFLLLESYRLERIAIWKHPEQYEKGYQTLQGLLAIGSGGLFGNGYGHSIQKLGFVPEAQNDMIFSIICEEFGFVGATCVVLLFFVLIWRLFLISIRTEDLFGSLLSSGVMAHMMIQVILNIAVVTNTIPNTGITLPFVSYGGTSVLFLLAEMGLVLNVSNLIK